jgi:hypothetical protein
MKLKGATLMESLIAMIILVVILGTCTMIYTNIMGSDMHVKKLKAISLAEKEACRVKSEKRFIDLETETENWSIRCSFEKYPSAEGLYQFSIAIRDENGKSLLVRNELIRDE